MTALDYVNANACVIIRYSNQYNPNGRDVAWFGGETDLSFELGKIKGRIEADGTFTATSRCIRDWQGNNVYGIWIRCDEAAWDSAYDAEFMGE